MNQSTKESIVKSLEKLGIKSESIKIEVPSDKELGDYAVPCFSFSKEMKKAPNIIAQELAVQLNEKIKRGLMKGIQIKATGPYLNFFLEKSNLAIEVIKKILKEKEKFGTEKNKQTIMIEFPSPNTNKPLHLGHLRNMSLGESVSRILEHKGNKIIRAWSSYL